MNEKARRACGGRGKAARNPVARRHHQGTAEAPFEDPKDSLVPRLEGIESMQAECDDTVARDDLTERRCWTLRRLCSRRGGHSAQALTQPKLRVAQPPRRPKCRLNRLVAVEGTEVVGILSSKDVIQMALAMS